MQTQDETNERNCCDRCVHCVMPTTTLYGLPVPEKPLCGHTQHEGFSPVFGTYRPYAENVRKRFPLCCPQYEPKPLVVTPAAVRVTLWQRVRAWLNL